MKERGKIMFCPKCGNEISDQSVVCPKCGCPTSNEVPVQQQASTSAPMLENGEKKSLATCALVFSFLMPIVGLILGIIGTIKYKTEKLKKQCIIAIPISIVVWIISAVIMLA
jgi:uncharacterized membrane protein YvbJ